MIIVFGYSKNVIVRRVILASFCREYKFSVSLRFTLHYCPNATQRAMESIDGSFCKMQINFPRRIFQSAILSLAAPPSLEIYLGRCESET